MPETMSAEDWALWRAFREMTGDLERVLERRLHADAGLSQADYGVLLALSEAPRRRLRTGEVAAALGWEKSRVSHQVVRMETRGLVERAECDNDGRGTWIGLTPTGRRTFLAATRDHSAAIREHLIDPIAPEDRDALARIIAGAQETLDPVCDTACAAERDTA